MADQNAAVQRCVNRWGARLIPLVLCGIVGYATWVVVVLLGVNQLLRGHSDGQQRTGAGIAIIVVHFVTLVPAAICYFRVLQIVFTNPGTVPLSLSSYSSPKSPPSSSAAASTEMSQQPPPFPHDPHQPPAPLPRPGFFDRGGVLNGRIPAPPGLQPFTTRKIYECDIDGLPRYCATCQIWKPDRSHHSSELGRCVYKMDHYCPWAGGMVAEPSFKFFVQFCGYACCFCAFVLISVAYFLALFEKSATGLDGFYEINFIVVIVLAGLFFLFTVGMVGNSIWFATENTTTVDNLTRRNRIYNFAVLLEEDGVSTNARPETLQNGAFATITFPLQGPGAAMDGTAATATARQQQQPRRTYAVISTPTGANPYKLRTPLANIKTVMGAGVLDWFLPIRHSPCFVERSEAEASTQDTDGCEVDVERRGEEIPHSLYKLGPDFDNALGMAGLNRPGDDGSRKGTSRDGSTAVGISEKKRRRRQSKSEGHSNRSRSKRSSSRGATDVAAEGHEMAERRHRKERDRRRSSSRGG